MSNRVAATGGRRARAGGAGLPRGRRRRLREAASSGCSPRRCCAASLAQRARQRVQRDFDARRSALRSPDAAAARGSGRAPRRLRPSAGPSRRPDTCPSLGWVHSGALLPLPGSIDTGETAGCVARRGRVPLVSRCLPVSTDLAPAPDLVVRLGRARAADRGRGEPRPPLARLARRYNPAMALSDGGIWPIDVRYTWARRGRPDGRGAGRRRRRGRAVRRRAQPRPRAPALERPARPGRARAAASATPSMPPATIARIPQQDQVAPRWDALVGTDPRSARTGAGGARLPAHPVRPRSSGSTAEQGLLGIQYWFFYPFNEWINRHEGDWEHVNVVLKGAERAEADGPAFRPVGYQFAFHGWRLETERRRAGGRARSRTRITWWCSWAARAACCGGGARPAAAATPCPPSFAARARTAVRPDEDTRAPERFIAARDFDVVLLPEPERLDAQARPELSWLALDFYAGQAARVHQPASHRLAGLRRARAAAGPAAGLERPQGQAPLPRRPSAHWWPACPCRSTGRCWRRPGPRGAGPWSLGPWRHPRHPPLPLQNMWPARK